MADLIKRVPPATIERVGGAAEKAEEQLARSHDLLLRHPGADELVATSPDEYVEIAARLVRDAAWRLQLRHEIAQRRSALFDDRAPVRALEDALFETARPA